MIQRGSHLATHGLGSRCSSVGVVQVDEAKAPGLPGDLIIDDDRVEDIAKGLEHTTQHPVIHILGQVAHVELAVIWKLVAWPHSGAPGRTPHARIHACTMMTIRVMTCIRRLLDGWAILASTNDAIAQHTTHQDWPRPRLKPLVLPEKWGTSNEDQKGGVILNKCFLLLCLF